MTESNESAESTRSIGSTEVTVIQDQAKRENVPGSLPPPGARTVPLKLGIAGRISALVFAMRPRQWTKNLVLFVGLVFAHRLLDWPSFERTALAFLAFCLASSSMYLLNDLLDLNNDRQHP